jgi:hypothetical protein
LDENSVKKITTMQLSATDQDSQPTELIYRITTQPQLGHLEHAASPGICPVLLYPPQNWDSESARDSYITWTGTPRVYLSWYLFSASLILTTVYCILYLAYSGDSIITS